MFEMKTKGSRTQTVLIKLLVAAEWSVIVGVCGQEEIQSLMHEQ